MRNLLVVFIFTLTGYIVQADCGQVTGKTIDLRGFGVIVNDGIDDSSSMQKAFDCAAQLYREDLMGRSSVKIVFPRGVIRVSRRLVIDLSSENVNYSGGWRGGSLVLVGHGADRSILRTTSRNSNLIEIFTRKAQPLIRQIIEVKDINFKAGTAVNQAALKITPELDSGQPNSHQLSITLNMQNVLIDSGVQDGYFKFGVRASFLNRPVLTNVKVRNQASILGIAGSACFEFDYSYGIDLNGSECLNAQFGVRMPRIAEGDQIIGNQFMGVDVGVFMRASRDFKNLPGPSATDGKISNNTIRFRDRGIYLEGKSWVTIAKNNLVYLSNGSYPGNDIYIRDCKKISINRNRLSGSGNSRIGILLVRSGNGFGDMGFLTYIYENSLSGFRNGIVTSAGTRYNIIFKNNYYNISKPLQLGGIKEQILNGG